MEGAATEAASNANKWKVMKQLISPSINTWEIATNENYENEEELKIEGMKYVESIIKLEDINGPQVTAYIRLQALANIHRFWCALCFLLGKI